MSQLLRRHGREFIDAKIQIGWQDPAGVYCCVTARCLDISELGMQLESREAIPARTYVNFRMESLGLEGTASVRHVSRVGLRHRLGLEFTGGLRWRQERLSSSRPTS